MEKGSVSASLLLAAGHTFIKEHNIYTGWSEQKNPDPDILVPIARKKPRDLGFFPAKRSTDSFSKKTNSLQRRVSTFKGFFCLPFKSYLRRK